jgi:hypothetical protein
MQCVWQHVLLAALKGDLKLHLETGGLTGGSTCWTTGVHVDSAAKALQPAGRTQAEPWKQFGIPGNGRVHPKVFG